MKTDSLVITLREKFPHTNISYKHKPIGGFQIPDLSRTVLHDVYQENPDLIIFHAYGGIEEGLYDQFIKNIRNRLSSDILLLDHHYVWNVPQRKLDKINQSHDEDSRAIKEIAKKYSCGFVNVREQWRAYMIANNIEANELMGNTKDPNVHPNDKGNELLRKIVLSAFDNKPKQLYTIRKDSLRESFFMNASTLKEKFKVNANLVEIKGKGQIDTPVFEVLIDGKKPSTIKSSYHISRPSKGFQSWMPAIKNISLGTKFPQDEQWTITIFNINRETKTYDFKLEGSKTGFDGKGNSREDFISNSQRIVIKRQDHNIFNIERILKNKTPEDYKVYFGVEQIVKDTIKMRNSKQKHLVLRTDYLGKHEISLNLITGSFQDLEIMTFKPFIN
ncbi:SGNH/GDSL hydrolase family protein [Winogradskyella sp. 3972H.M.0a.05]|uniref:SGNH/GDSL hydrolase family protein n=1 Tax=Winogradskyella sp. 3972H.M.0a.05 TaxID=2950277 RepID=UPI003396EA6C